MQIVAAIIVIFIVIPLLLQAFWKTIWDSGIIFWVLKVAGVLAGGLALVVWLIWLLGKRDKSWALKLVLYLIAGATIGYILGLILGVFIFGDYSDKDWGTITLTHDQEEKRGNFGVLGAGLGAAIGCIFAVFNKSKS